MASGETRTTGVSAVDPFAPPSDPSDGPGKRLPQSGTEAPREFNEFSLEPSGGPDLIPGTLRDPSVAAVRSRRAVPGFGAHGGAAPPLRTRPRRLSEQDSLPPSAQPGLRFDQPRPASATPSSTAARAAGPAQLRVPSAESRVLLVGLDAFDDFIEDDDIPVVGDGPKWPDPPRLDRDGSLVTFRAEPTPVKWGWAETWTSPPPQEWRTTTDGELDDDIEVDVSRRRLEFRDDDAAPTTQSPLGQLRGRREFAVDESAPGFDVPRARQRPDSDEQLQPRRRSIPLPADPEAPLRRSSTPDRDASWPDGDSPGLRQGVQIASLPTAPPLPGTPREPSAPRQPDPIRQPGPTRRPGPAARPSTAPPPATSPPGSAPRPAISPPGSAPRPGTPPSPPGSVPTPPPKLRRSDAATRPDDIDNDERDGARSPSRRRSILAFVGLSVVFALLLQNFVLQANSIPSTSMSPTLVIDDYVLVNKVSYLIGDPGRGDVVVFERPESVPSEDDVFIKRVVGLPGETVTFVEGKVVINGEPLEETYIASKDSSFPLVDQIPGCGPPRPDGACVIPEDSIFVMGDNRRNSSDSRRFGPIPIDTIEGRAFIRVWPSSRVGGL